MPFFFIILGLGLLVIGYRGTQDEFFSLLKGDLTGPNNFVVFAAGIFAIGLVGYLPKTKDLSNAFLALVIIGIILKNKGFFENFMAQITSETSTPSQKPIEVSP